MIVTCEVCGLGLHWAIESSARSCFERAGAEKKIKGKENIVFENESMDITCQS